MGFSAKYKIDIPKVEIQVERGLKPPSERKDMQQWSIDEKLDVWNAYKRGEEIWSIASRFGRSERAVRDKILAMKNMLKAEIERRETEQRQAEQ